VSKSREERAKALEEWADKVDTSDLKPADTQALRTIAELVDRRMEVDEQITEAVISARRAERSWSEIGTMLGVSKQAAQAQVFVQGNQPRRLIQGWFVVASHRTNFRRRAPRFVVCRSVEAQDGQYGGVHTPLLLRGEVAGQLPETSDVDRSHLLHEDSRVSTFDLDLGPE
jgi:hypothetical protein